MLSCFFSRLSIRDTSLFSLMPSRPGRDMVLCGRSADTTVPELRIPQRPSDVSRLLRRCSMELSAADNTPSPNSPALDTFGVPFFSGEIRALLQSDVLSTGSSANSLQQTKPCKMHHTVIMAEAVHISSDQLPQNYKTCLNNKKPKLKNMNDMDAG